MAVKNARRNLQVVEVSADRRSLARSEGALQRFCGLVIVKIWLRFHMRFFSETLDVVLRVTYLDDQNDVHLH